MFLYNKQTYYILFYKYFLRCRCYYELRIKKLPTGRFFYKWGSVLYFIFNILLRCGIGYYIYTDAVGVYNGKMAVAPRFFAKFYGNGYALLF